MELIIFKKNEISPEIFTVTNVNRDYCYSNNPLKSKNYGDYSLLETTKSKLDTFNSELETLRRAAAKYYYEYDLLKVICKKNVVSRAYFKLYELLYDYSILYLDNLECVFLCEAPGGFIDAVLDIRRKKNLRVNYFTVSKDNSPINFNQYIEPKNLLYIDIIKNVDTVIRESLKRFPDKVLLVTADGGFDVLEFNKQEILLNKLILSEIIIALSIQRVHGTAVIKIFDMFTHNSIVMYLILCSFYSEVKIIKPNSSRNSNSERYLVCNDFSELNVVKIGIIESLKTTLRNYLLSNTTFTILYPDLNLEQFDKLKLLKNINNLISDLQIKVINNSIDMVNNKNLYFQNLLIHLFTSNFKLEYLNDYNSILKSKIKTCVEFLKKYSLNTINIQFN